KEKDPNPVVKSVTPANHEDEWQSMKNADADLVIFDTPARLSDHTIGPIELADLVIITDGVSLIQTNENHSAYCPYCRGHALPPNWLKACNPARNGGVDDHHHRVYHGVVL